MFCVPATFEISSTPTASHRRECSKSEPEVSEIRQQVKPTSSSLLQQPGPKKFKLSKIKLIYKANKFKVPLFTI